MRKSYVDSPLGSESSSMSMGTDSREARACSPLLSSTRLKGWEAVVAGEVDRWEDAKSLSRCPTEKPLFTTLTWPPVELRFPKWEPRSTWPGFTFSAYWRWRLRAVAQTYGLRISRDGTLELALLTSSQAVLMLTEVWLLLCRGQSWLEPARFTMVQKGTHAALRWSRQAEYSSASLYVLQFFGWSSRPVQCARCHLIFLRNELMWEIEIFHNLGHFLILTQNLKCLFLF